MSFVKSLSKPPIKFSTHNTFEVTCFFSQFHSFISDKRALILYYYFLASVTSYEVILCKSPSCCIRSDSLFNYALIPTTFIDDV